MSWLQLDDNMTDHPKIAVISDAAFRDHVEGLCYCARLLTDGFIPDKAAKEITTPKTLRELSTPQLPEKGPLWDRVEHGWVIHDYLDWNKSREQVLAKRETRAAAGRRGGLANAQAKAKQTLDPPPSNSLAFATPIGRTPSHSHSEEVQDQSLSPRSNGATDHKIKAKDLAADTAYEIERLIEQLPDRDQGTAGRLVALARRGATARHFADARQGIATSTTNGSPSKKACRIIENAIAAELAS